MLESEPTVRESRYCNTRVKAGRRTGQGCFGHKSRGIAMSIEFAMSCRNEIPKTVRFIHVLKDREYYKSHRKSTEAV